MTDTTDRAASITFSLKGRHRYERVEEPLHHRETWLPRITEALALAIHFEDMVQSGQAKDYADVARLAGLCRERVSQIVRLIFLAPDIQLEVLSLSRTVQGRCSISEVALRRIANELDWSTQRQLWFETKEFRCKREGA